MPDLDYLRTVRGIEMPSRQNGVSLIEVLITLLVLSIGLLGLAAIQGFSLQAGQISYYRTQAVNITYEVADLTRAHRGEFLGCGGGDALFNFSYDRVVERAEQMLPDGAVDIATDVNGVCGIDRGGSVTVTVTWLDNREESEEASFSFATQI